MESSSIVYDAATTHGGSGGPVLDQDGEVIVVNYAMLKGFSGAQLAESREPLPRAARVPMTSFTGRSETP